MPRIPILAVLATATTCFGALMEIFSLTGFKSENITAFGKMWDIEANENYTDWLDSGFGEKTKNFSSRGLYCSCTRPFFRKRKSTNGWDIMFFYIYKDADVRDEYNSYGQQEVGFANSYNGKMDKASLDSFASQNNLRLGLFGGTVLFNPYFRHLTGRFLLEVADGNEFNACQGGMALLEWADYDSFTGPYLLGHQDYSTVGLGYKTNMDGFSLRYSEELFLVRLSFAPNVSEPLVLPMPTAPSHLPPTKNTKYTARYYCTSGTEIAKDIQGGEVGKYEDTFTAMLNFTSGSADHTNPFWATPWTDMESITCGDVKTYYQDNECCTE